MLSIKSNQKFVKIPANVDGRDFVVGDLHGCYDELMLLLEHVNFNKEQDRLFCVGDLIDRGPKPKECLELLHEKWFYPVLGNHETLLLEFIHKIKIGNLKGISPEKIPLYKTLMPFVDQILEIPLGYVVSHILHGCYYIVHGEIVPEHLFQINMSNSNQEYNKYLEKMKTEDLTSQYEFFFEQYAKHDLAESLKQKLLWSRKIINEFYNDHKESLLQQDFSFLDNIKIKQKLKIFCGHNVVPFPMKIGQQYYIDTGAALGYRNKVTLSNQELFSQFGHEVYTLSMVDIDTGICYGCVTSSGSNKNNILKLKKSLYK